MDLDTVLFIQENVERINNERMKLITDEIGQMVLEETKQPKVYKFDASTIHTIEDVRNVLEGLDMVITDDSPHYETVKKYFTEVDE